MRTVLALVQGDAVLLDGMWDDLIIEAESAGYLGARKPVPLQRDATGLELQSRVEVEVGPPGNPVAAWLLCTGRAALSVSGTAVVDVEPKDRHAHPATRVSEQQSYAAAYCTVLAEEAGAVTTWRIVPATTRPVELPTPRDAHDQLVAQREPGCEAPRTQASPLSQGTPLPRATHLPQFQ
ncbi:hypothetical protein AB0L13_33845 [Saccharopolyspora shandongensis]|uniref:hypothetical protein n=1 Tax=Saccharopolyspora shandongensis TaxID=418495 RepID=UPI00342625BB